MKRVFSIITLTVMALVMFPLAPAGVSSAQSTSTSKGCTSLSVLLLVDQSRSLQTTDPNSLRVDGAESLIKSLSNSASASGEKINLGIAGFGEGAELVDETTLPERQADATQAIQVFRDRNTDLNTDYVLALKYAVQYFADRPGVPVSCNRLVWFTDGAYSIDKREAAGIASYTTSRDKRTIQNQLGEQICGPLPDGSQLGASVSESIRTAGFSIQMIDLRNEDSETPQDRVERARTAPVIERLLGEDRSDPCRVLGGRVEASQASSLATEFFRQGQIALGHYELDCAQLSGGYPASLVNALAVKNSNADEVTKILIDGKVREEGQEFANYAPKGGPAKSGSVTVQTGSGQLETCFADLQASIGIQGNASVFGMATRSFLNFKVTGAGDGSDAAGVAKTAVSIAAKVDGKPASVEWDEVSRSWRVTVEGPVTSPPVVDVTAIAVGWQGPEFKAPATPIQLRNEPPVPLVAWVGPTTVEGTEVAKGSLRVSPAAEDTGGTLCVTFGQPISSNDTLSLTLSDTAELCRPDKEEFELPASLSAASTSNTTAQIALSYTATYTPEGSTTPIKIGGTESVTFPPVSLVKPADGGTILLISLVLWVVSMLLSYGLLVWLTNRQLRLPDPSLYRAITVPLAIDDSGLRRVDDTPLRMEDFKAISGDQSKYRLDGGISMERRRTWNPYARLSAFSRPQSGVLATQPSITRGFDSRVESAIPFDETVWVNVNTVTKVGTAVVLVRRGVRAEAASESIDRAVLGLQRHLDSMPKSENAEPDARPQSDAGASRPVESPSAQRPASPVGGESNTPEQLRRSSSAEPKRAEPRLPPRPA